MPVGKESVKSLKNFPPLDNYLDRLGYVKRLVGIGGEYEEFIFAEDATPPAQISAYLENLAPEKLKQGVSVAQVGNNIVKYGRDDWSREDFHTSITLYLDRDKYTTTFIIVNGKAETYIFAKGFTPHEQILSYLKSLDPKMLKSEGVSVTQVGNNVSYRQTGSIFRRLLPIDPMVCPW